MTEMPAIATTPAAATSSFSALDVLCAEPLLRAPLVDRLERDGHRARLHDADDAPDGTWEPASGLAVVVLPTSTIDTVRHGWMSFVKNVADHVSMVLVACVGNVSAPLLSGAGRDHGFVVLDRDALDEDWTASISASVDRAGSGIREIAPTLQSTRTAVTGISALTPNERKILRLISEGLSNSAIAEFQYVGERTVESHIRRIYAKLELPDTPRVQRRVLATLLYLGEQRSGSLAD
jgi:DNA-binding CsgD family transcriptional regulator